MYICTVYVYVYMYICVYPIHTCIHVHMYIFIRYVCIYFTPMEELFYVMELVQNKKNNKIDVYVYVHI